MKIIKKTPSPTQPEWWNRNGVENFKESLRLEHDAIVAAGAGEVVTIRVQTNSNGNCLFWEFATDYYDVGFGLSFEWASSGGSGGCCNNGGCSGDSGYSVGGGGGGGCGSGGHSNTNKDGSDGGDSGDSKDTLMIDKEMVKNNKNNNDDADDNDTEEDRKKRRVDEIIPVKRVASHKDVQCGSHKYPGEGVYLLIFDNSFSLWRAKNVYYRFFYAK